MRFFRYRLVIQQIWVSNVDTFRAARKTFGWDYIAVEKPRLADSGLALRQPNTLLQSTRFHRVCERGLGIEKLSDTTTYDFRILMNISAAGPRIPHKRELLT